MLTLCTNFKNIRHQKYLIWHLKCLPSFQKPTLNRKKYSLTITKHSISVRGPKIWNEFLTKEEKYNSIPHSEEKLRLNYLKVTMKGNTFK